MSEKIELKVDGQQITCDAGQTLLDVIEANDIPISTACGGHGACHLCRVVIRSGAERLAAPTQQERKVLGDFLINRGSRLACSVLVDGPMEVTVPPRKRKKRGQRGGPTRVGKG